MDEQSPERREFVRIRTELPVRYKFLSQDPAFKSDNVFDGVATDLSGGGLLLQGKIPQLDWITGLLMDRIYVGLNLQLEEDDEAIKALTRVAWVESIDEQSGECAMGLRFKEITRDGQDRIFQFVIRSHLP